ncbi:MAG: adenylate/guanylate cyclase domain-containing protein [Bacteroidota bacterium]
MKISPKARRSILQIIPFGILSMAFNLVYVLIEKGILGDHPIYPSTGNPYYFNPWIIVLLTGASGLFMGSIEVFYLNKKFNRSTFIKKVFFKTSIYLILLTLLIFVNVTLSNTFEFGTDIWDEQVWEDTRKFFSSFAFWSIFLFLGLLISVALFYREVSDNIGQEVLFNFFTGKYHHPIEEQRIFMFLDMKSSTTIAEKLGHVQYFNMLREYYADLSERIIEYEGEIYQYVGDEIVLSWKLQQGLRNQNCIRTFFAMKRTLLDQEKKYQTRYGISPRFKAGLHFGQVTTGEIGEIKKDIIFTGDVLNATARIQGLCNHYQTDLLISGELKEALSLGDEYQVNDLGEAELRGRNEKMKIYSLIEVR